MFVEKKEFYHLQNITSVIPKMIRKVLKSMFKICAFTLLFLICTKKKKENASLQVSDKQSSLLIGYLVT